MRYAVDPFSPNVDKIVRELGNWKLYVTIEDSRPEINFMLSINVWLEHPSIGRRKVVADFNRRDGKKIDGDLAILCTMAMEGNKACEMLYQLLTNKRLSFEEKYYVLLDIQWLQDRPSDRVVNGRGEVVAAYYNT